MLLSEVASLIDARHGVFYLAESQQGETALKLVGSYGYKERKHISTRFRLGEGLVGQCAEEKQRILLTDVPADYIQINSGLGEAPPLNIVLLPVIFEGNVLALMELASFKRYTEIQLSFLEQLAESVGIVLNTIGATMRTEDLLRESQALSEELQSQQDELRQTNVDLEEKAELLEKQNQEVEHKRKEVEEARAELQEQTEQLTLTSKYKSQFLTNMSHELRTPLNSMLVLAQLLSENREGNLTEKQTEYAETIHASGGDLLNLINDILDLSKIEAGATTMELGQVSLAEICDGMERSFRQIAEEKTLQFTISMDGDLPGALHTDSNRLQQVLRNLLSNSFKFTDDGSVTLSVKPATSGWSRSMETLNSAESVVAFSVADTGIGIPADQHQLIFEAFKQVDGTSARRYAGTGLGLAISREVARLLGGELVLTASTLGEGSIFTLYVPYNGGPHSPAPGGGAKGGGRKSPPPTRPVPDERPAIVPLELDQVPDDRAHIEPGDPVLLIIEDDMQFAKVLLNTARKQGFKGLVTTLGERGLELARRYQPDGITLDIDLPAMSGWAVLDQFKHDPSTRHIPVHIITIEQEQRLEGLKQGAIGVLEKPATPDQLRDTIDRLMGFARRSKSLLVIEDDEAERMSIVELIGGDDVQTTAVETGEEALAVLKEQTFDCIVLDLSLPDMDGLALLNKMKKARLQETPVIVYTGRDLTKKEETQLLKIAQTIIVKGAKSPERLLDEASLFLHRIETELPVTKRKMLQKSRQMDPTLAGKQVLVVDDDVRNLFATTSLLEELSMEGIVAESGQAGIELLQNTPDIDLVLMDIMMPQMDGYETIRRIRQEKRFASLPIIAVTAKAMKGDREKCIEAGASDYISKPVDKDQLISLIRVWLHKA